MMVKLVSSPGMYSFRSVTSSVMYRFKSFCCRAVRLKASGRFTGVKGVSPKHSITAGPAYSRASFFRAS